VLPSQASAIEKLYNWSINFNGGCNPFCLFIDLIGYSIENWGEPYFSETYDYRKVLGYKELCLLGDALKVFENHGYDEVYAWCDALEEAEEAYNH